MRRLLPLLSALVVASSPLAAQEGATVRICDASYGLFTPPRVPELQVVVSSDRAASGEIRFDVETDRGERVCTFARAYRLAGGDSVRVGFRFDAEPGFYRATVGDGSREVGSFRFGCDPERILSPADAAPDFDAFWAEALAELAAVAPRYRLHLDRERSTAARRIYLVEMRSLGGEVIRGYYAEPVAPGKYPAVITYMGYGSDAWCPDADAAPDRVELVLSHRGQGLDKPRNRYGDWVVSGIGSPATYYYRGAYMDAVRAVDFVASRERVDPALIFAEGGSQGGALTLAVCALDGRIAAAAPFVPFMSDFPDYLRIAPWPAEALFAAAARAGITESELFRTLSYFDIKNLAGRVRCPVLMGFGLQDEVCPPHTNFAGYNLLGGPKRWMVFPRRGHDVHEEPSWYAARDAFFADQIRKIGTNNNY